MADETTFPAIIEGAVLAGPVENFYDGYVPEKVPQTDGYVDPYVVLWAGLGSNPFEPTACGRHNSDTVIWDFQTTVVAATPDLCRQAAKSVRTQLTNLVIGTGRVKPNPDFFDSGVPLPDPQTTPTRFMLVLQWRITTN